MEIDCSLAFSDADATINSDTSEEVRKRLATLLWPGIKSETTEYGEVAFPESIREIAILSLLFLT